MLREARTRGTAVLLAVLATLATAAAAPTTTAAKSRGCASFASQSDAQAHFARIGGGPSGRIGRRLDPDRDGVACEGNPAPYAGFANLGYSKRKRFFFGFAWLPPDPTNPDGFTCLRGNRHFPEGPRLLRLYRVVDGKPRRVGGRDGRIAAAAEPEAGRVVWKLPARRARGRFFVAFEARIPLTPYGRNECPGFRSRTVALPRPTR